MRDLAWTFDDTLESVRRKPSPGLATAFHKCFARIFSLRTGYGELDRLWIVLVAEGDEQLKVSERPDPPLLHQCLAEGSVQLCHQPEDFDRDDEPRC